MGNILANNIKLDLTFKLVNGSWVGQVGPVDPCGQVGDLDLSFANSRNLSWVGQKYRPVQVKMTSLI